MTMDINGSTPTEEVGVQYRSESNMSKASTLLNKGRKSGAASTVAGAAVSEGPKSSNPFTCVTGVLLTLSIIVFSVFFASYFAFDDIRNLIIRHYSIISSTDSYLFDVWQNPGSQGVQPHRKFTFFNMTNPEEVLYNGAAPNYQLLGPYCYQEVTQKFDIRFSEDRKSVNYKYSNTFHFDPSCSQVDTDRFGPASTYPYGDSTRALSEDDELVIPNMGIFGLRYRLGLVPGPMMSFMPKQDLCDILSLFVAHTPVGNTSLFIKVRVKDLLWGYPDEIWTLAHPYLSLLEYYASTSMLTEWNGTYPVPSPYTYRSGQLCPLYQDYTNGCNNTLNQDTIEETGVDDYTRAGVLTQWAGQQQLWWWGVPIDGYTSGEDVVVNQPAVGISDDPFPAPYHEECPVNLSTGTNGMRWGPIDVVSKSKPLPAYADFCFRNMDFEYSADSTIKGIDSWRFGLPASAMSNSTQNKKCFQQHRDGFFNFTQTILGPVYAVKNWFLGAPFHDSEVNVTFSVPNESEPVPLRTYLNAYLDGSDPVAFQQRFDSFIDVEPLTGTTLQAVVQGMAVTPLGKIAIDGCDLTKAMSWTDNVTDTLVPLVILERYVIVPDNLASEIRLRLFQMNLAQDLIYVGIALGAVAIVAVLAFVLIRKRRAQKGYGDASESEALLTQDNVQ